MTEIKPGSRDTHKVSEFAFFCRTKQGSRDNNYCNIFIVETMNNKDKIYFRSEMCAKICFRTKICHKTLCETSHRIEMVCYILPVRVLKLVLER